MAYTSLLKETVNTYNNFPYVTEGEEDLNDAKNKLYIQYSRHWKVWCYTTASHMRGEIKSQLHLCFQIFHTSQL